jgi:hypothetical protein
VTTLGHQQVSAEAFRQARAALKVSPYERVSSLLIALLVLVGVGVFCLLMAWLSSRVLIRQTAIPVMLEETGGGGVETGFGTEGTEIDAPQVSDVAQVGGVTENKFAETVTELANVVTETSASGDQPELLDLEEAAKGGSSRGTGKHAARGRGGGSGGGEGSGIGKSRQDRWEIEFRDTDSLEAYSRQLDFFGIELGVMDNSIQVVYVKNLSKPRPDVRTGRRDEESRMYMTWRRGPLQQADRELVKRAGVSPVGRVVLQFFSAELENQLAWLEKQYKGRKAQDIRRTRFGVKVVGKGFEFFVEDQSTF